MGKLIIAKSNRGTPELIGIHDIAGDQINPSTEDKQDDQVTLLEQIEQNTANIDIDMDSLVIEAEEINLNTDELEALSQETIDAIGQKSGTDVATELIDINDKLERYLNPFPGLSIRKFLLNTGSPDMNVDGSVTPVIFTSAPPSGKIWYIHNISIVMEDNGIIFTKFAGRSVLLNGVDFKAKQNGLTEELLGNIKYNGEFYTFANQVILESSTIDILVAQITIKQSSGTTLKLVNSESDNMSVIINDNLTGISKFQILVRGYEVDE